MTNFTKKNQSAQVVYKKFKASILAIFIMTILVITMLALCVWQINRGNYKKTIINNQAIALKFNNVINNITKLNSALITDEFNCNGKKILLKDLQKYNNKTGYHVIMPCSINNNNILVNLGFIEKNKLQELKPYQKQFKRIKLKGYLRIVQNNPFIKQIQHKQIIFPFIMQGVQINYINKITQIPNKPVILLISENYNFGFQKNWQLYSLSPKKHYFYALQWFLFALISVIIFIYANLETKNDS